MEKRHNECDCPVLTCLARRYGLGLHPGTNSHDFQYTNRHHGCGVWRHLRHERRRQAQREVRRHDGNPSGDTWYTSWGADGTAWLTQDDGNGFDNPGGLFARHRLCRLEGDPNVSTETFRGVNLNPGLLGDTMPHHQATPEWRIGYSSSIHEQDGVLYEIRHNWSKGTALWPPIASSILKSSDGGKTWINHLGQVNRLPDASEAMFPACPGRG